jgi:uncharacterized membrane protein YgdD (TMEM256/DUF423 family)
MVDAIKEYDEEIYTQNEKYGFYMFNLIGLVLIAVGSYRLFSGIAIANMTVDVGILIVGCAIFFGSLYFKKKSGPTPEELEELKKREEEEELYGSDQLPSVK